MTKVKLYYPEHGDPQFAQKLNNLEEYQQYTIPKLKTIKNANQFENIVQESCSGFDKTYYQYLMAHYLSKRSPYKSLFLFHGVGVGKTCSSITIAESLLLDHSRNESPKIIVVAPKTLQKSYQSQIFSIVKLLTKQDLKAQCTGEIYRNLVHGVKDSDQIVRNISQLIKSRYIFLTYDGLITYYQENPHVKDKLIIIDEVHNLRIGGDKDKEKKKANDVLLELLENGSNNRLVLLSATPMYNEPDEIFWILSFLLKNDHRKDVKIPSTISLFKKEVPDEKSIKLLKQL